MDYVPGESLNANTSADNLLPVPTVFRLLADVADALDYAHQQGIIHRDVKPSNLIHDPRDDRVKLTDLGIARLADTSSTRTGSVLGTPSYMAPEQIRGERIDGRADIFALGVTLYELLTGELPFQGETLAALAYQITHAKHPSVKSRRDDLPAAATRIVNRALAKKPDKRYASATEMGEALRRAAGRGARQGVAG